METAPMPGVESASPSNAHSIPPYTRITLCWSHVSHWNIAEAVWSALKRALPRAQVSIQREMPVHAVEDPTHLWIIVAQQCWPSAARVLPPHPYIVMQTEQYDAWGFNPHNGAPENSANYNLLANALEVWDYSLYNIASAHCEPRLSALSARQRFVPFLYDAQILQPAQVIEWDAKPYDVIIAGWAAPPRRREIIDYLSRNGIRVTNVCDRTHKAFADALAQARIVLNWHASDHHCVLEQGRLIFALAHGSYVVSERSSDIYMDAFYENSVDFVDKGIAKQSLLEIVRGVLANPQAPAIARQRQQQVFQRTFDLSWWLRERVLPYVGQREPRVDAGESTPERLQQAVIDAEHGRVSELYPYFLRRVLPHREIKS